MSASYKCAIQITKSILIINSKDYHYFPYKEHSMMAVFVHLDDTDQSNGGLGVFPGSHLQGPQVEKREKNQLPTIRVN